MKRFFISYQSYHALSARQHNRLGPLPTQNMDNIQAKLEQKGFVRGRNVEPVTRLLGQSSSTQSVLTRAELTRQQWKVIDLEQQRKQWEGVDLRRLILL